MWKRCELSKTDKYSTARAECAKGSGTNTAKLTLCHTFRHACFCSFVSGDRDVIRFLHQRQFSGRLEHSTTCRDWRCKYILQRRRGLANAIVKKEPDTLLNTNRSGSDSAIT